MEFILYMLALFDTLYITSSLLSGIDKLIGSPFLFSMAGLIHQNRKIIICSYANSHPKNESFEVLN